jgi:hypothetical protein
VFEAYEYLEKVKFVKIRLPNAFATSNLFK